MLKAQLPSVQMKILCGADGMDTWTDVRIWDDFLHNVGLVVSTPQVLFDAVSHGFVKLQRLSLIVFDEGRPSSPR